MKKRENKIEGVVLCTLFIFLGIRIIMQKGITTPMGEFFIKTGNASIYLGLLLIALGLYVANYYFGKK